MKFSGNGRKKEIEKSPGELPKMSKPWSVKVINLKSFDYFFCLKNQASANPEGPRPDAWRKGE
jgi:hypothetical protein